MLKTTKQHRKPRLHQSSKSIPSQFSHSKTPHKQPKRSFFSFFKSKTLPDDNLTPSNQPQKKLLTNIELPKVLEITVPILSSTEYSSIDSAIFPQILTISNHKNYAPGDTFHENENHNDSNDSNDPAIPQKYIDITTSTNSQKSQAKTFGLPKDTHVTIQHSQSPSPLSSTIPLEQALHNATDLRQYTSIYSLPPTRLATNESDSSYFLPIIRVGPVPFALMQVRASSPQSSHLRLLGGPAISTDTTSIVTASIHSDLQSNHHTSSILNQFNSMYEIQKSIGVSKYREKFEDHKYYTDDQIALRVLSHLPLSLNYSIDGETLMPTQEMDQFTRFRLQTSANASTSSLGRVVATHLTQRKYPADPPKDFHSIMQSPKDVTKVPKSVLPHAIHVIDYGELPPLSRQSLEPTIFSPILPQSIIYPELFDIHFRSSLKTPQEFNQVAPLLRLSALLMSSQSLYPLVKRSNQGNIARQFSKLPPDQPQPILSPFPSSLTPWYTLIKTLESVTVQSVHNPAIMDNVMNLYKLIENEYWVDSAVHLQHTLKSPSASANGPSLVDLLHPTLQAWLLPYLYHVSKPGSEQQNARGQKVNYRDWGANSIPSVKNEAQSLQWVPLVDLLHIDENLRPRFNSSSSSTPPIKSSLLNTTPPLRRHNNRQLDHDELNMYTNVERNEDMFKSPKAPSMALIDDILGHQGPDVNTDDLHQLQAVQDQYEYIRPDLSFAYQHWHKYYRTQLNPIDRKLLQSTSHLPPQNSPYISEFGQIITTSIGHSYPIRHSHHEMMNDVGLKLYLGNIITETRKSAFSIVGEAHILEQAKNRPSVLRDMGLSITELQDFFPRSSEISTELHRLYFDPSYTGVGSIYDT